MPPIDDRILLAALALVFMCMWFLGLLARAHDRRTHREEREKSLEITREMTDRLWRLSSNRDVLAEDNEETRRILGVVNKNIVALARKMERKP